MSLASLRASAGTFPTRRALVIGGTSGIGHGVAVRLARAEFDVTIAGRNAEAANSVLEEMKAAGSGKHAFRKIDASLMSGVKSFAEEFRTEQDRLDVLVLTQGMFTLQGRTETKEGTDVKLALHYYSRMAAIQLLLPLLRQSSSPRVLSVLSGGVHSPYSSWSTDPELKTSFSLKDAADAAGFYTDLTLDTFASQPENTKVLFIHAAPGVVSTNIGSQNPWYIWILGKAALMLGMSKEDSAEYLCAPLLKPDAEAGTGLLIKAPKNVDAVKTKGHSEEAREAVWKSTVEVWKRGGIVV